MNAVRHQEVAGVFQLESLAAILTQENKGVSNGQQAGVIHQWRTRRGGPFGGEGDIGACPFLRRAFDAEGSAMQLCKTFAERKPKPDAFVLPA